MADENKPKKKPAVLHILILRKAMCQFSKSEEEIKTLS